MTRGSARSLWAVPALAAVALGLALPAFGAAPGPTISGYAATNPRGVPILSAPPGAPMLILGANFGTTTGTVAFGGIPAPTPASWSTTEILVTVPTASSYPFKAPVTVTTSGQTASGPAFTITPPPPPPPPPPPSGDLDPGFGMGGTVLTDFGSNAGANSLAVQANGQIVAAGSSWADGKYNFALARYNANGSLDTAFGSGGKVVTDFGGSVAQAVAVQPDGRIVAAGWSYANGKYDFALARYNGNGTLDTAFGTGGMVRTDFGHSAGATAVAVQPDGQIVVAGGSYPANGKAQFALVRYNGNGSLDTTFGTGGTVLTDLGGNDAAYAVALQPDGRIVAAGSSSASGKTQFALARYNADGTLDTAFGTGGKALTDFGGDEGANAVAVQANGQIVVAGSSNANGNLDLALARYNANGSLDTAFGTSGMVLTDFGGNDVAYAAVVQPDGQIVVAGESNANGNTEFALARYRGR